MGTPPPHGDGPERPQLDRHQPVLGPLDVGALDCGNYRPFAAHCDSVHCWSIIRRSRAAPLLGRIEIRLKLSQIPVQLLRNFDNWSFEIYRKAALMV